MKNWEESSQTRNTGRGGGWLQTGLAQKQVRVRGQDHRRHSQTLKPAWQEPAAVQYEESLANLAMCKDGIIDIKVNL